MNSLQLCERHYGCLHFSGENIYNFPNYQRGLRPKELKSQSKPLTPPDDARIAFQALVGSFCNLFLDQS